MAFVLGSNVAEVRVNFAFVSDARSLKDNPYVSLAAWSSGMILRVREVPGSIPGAALTASVSASQPVAGLERQRLLC